MSSFQRRLLLLSMIALGCGDAPHSNPLDPQSPSFKSSGTLSGQVTVRNQGTGIPSATVSCLNNGASVQTDKDGFFAFSELLVGSVSVIAAKAGFTPDTEKVQIDPGAAAHTSFALNGAPVITNAKIISHKYDQYYPSAQYFVEVSASITDPNGVAEVDSAWLAADTLTFPLSYSITSKLFEATIYKYDFPTNSVQWLVGKALTVQSTDRYGAIGVSTPFYVTRVIENTATPTFPTSLNNDTTGSQPLLQWASPSVTFNYSYLIELARVDAGVETPIWQYSQLSSFYSELQFPSDGSGQTLLPGNYVWRISIVDDFGNSSRSKGAYFVVK